jgi:hypothetical protein
MLILGTENVALSPLMVFKKRWVKNPYFCWLAHGLDLRGFITLFVPLKVLQQRYELAENLADFSGSLKARR